MKHSIRIASLAVLALALAGCRSSTTDNGVSRNSDGSVHVETSEGTFDAGSQKMPSNWPSDVPAYAGASIQYSATMNPTTGKDGSMVVLQTSDKIQTVIDFYKAQVASNGWKITADMQNTDSRVIMGEKDDRVLAISIAGDGDHVTITIGVGKK